MPPLPACRVHYSPLGTGWPGPRHGGKAPTAPQAPRAARSLGAEDHAGRTKATPHQQCTCAAPTPTGGWGRASRHARSTRGGSGGLVEPRACDRRRRARPAGRPCEARRDGRGNGRPEGIKKKKKTAAELQLLLFTVYCSARVRVWNLDRVECGTPSRRSPDPDLPASCVSTVPR